MSIRTMKDTGSEYTISSNVDGAVYALATPDCICGGMGDEFSITTSASSLTVTFTKGSQAVLCGNSFWLVADETVTLPSESTFYLCARIDTSKPNGQTGSFESLSESAIKSENINDGGVRDLKLYKITTSTSGVTSCEDIRKINDATQFATKEEVESAIAAVNNKLGTQVTYSYSSGNLTITTK